MLTCIYWQPRNPVLVIHSPIPLDDYLSEMDSGQPREVHRVAKLREYFLSLFIHSFDNKI